MKPAWIIVSGVVLFALLGGAFYFFKIQQSGTSNISLATSSAALPASVALPSTPQAPAGMSEYQSRQYHLALFYPSDLAVKEFNEGGGAATVTFQNPRTIKGFQIFIVPYTKSQISIEQFKKDEPSGVRENLKDITIAGAPGAAFYSKNTTLGSTYEIWFIKNDFLYEITAPKSLEGWLGEVLQTWQFI